MKLMVKIPEEVYDHVLKAKSTPDILGIDIVNVINAVKNGTPLDNLKDEIEDYITHSPYINGCINCCRLRDDVCRIIDKYKE